MTPLQRGKCVKCPYMTCYRKFTGYQTTEYEALDGFMQSAVDIIPVVQWHPFSLCLMASPPKIDSIIHPKRVLLLPGSLNNWVAFTTGCTHAWLHARRERRHRLRSPEAFRRCTRAFCTHLSKAPPASFQISWTSENFQPGGNTLHVLCANPLTYRGDDSEIISEQIPNSTRLGCCSMPGVVG